MNLVSFSLKTKGVHNFIRRLHTVFTRFGFSESVSYRALYALLQALQPYRSSPTFFIPAVVLQRHPQLLAEIAGRGAEIGIHGLVHNDYRTLSAEQQRAIGPALATRPPSRSGSVAHDVCPRRHRPVHSTGNTIVDGGRNGRAPASVHACTLALALLITRRGAAASAAGRDRARHSPERPCSRAQASGRQVKRRGRQAASRAPPAPIPLRARSCGGCTRRSVCRRGR